MRAKLHVVSACGNALGLAVLSKTFKDVDVTMRSLENPQKYAKYRDDETYANYKTVYDLPQR